jgi:hypothetical protein
VTLLAIPSGSDESPSLNWAIHLICQIEFTVAVRRQLSKFIWKLGFQVSICGNHEIDGSTSKFKEKTAGGSTN